MLSYKNSENHHAVNCCFIDFSSPWLLPRFSNKTSRMLENFKSSTSLTSAALISHWLSTSPCELHVCSSVRIHHLKIIDDKFHYNAMDTLLECRIIFQVQILAFLSKSWGSPFLPPHIFCSKTICFWALINFVACTNWCSTFNLIRLELWPRQRWSADLKCWWSAFQ